MPISNYLPSSRLVQPGVCTSMTRPASPYQGQAIFETDTNRTLYYYNGGWFPAWNTAWGTIAVSTLANGASPAGNPAQITTITFTHVANRRVLISAYGKLGFSGTSNTAMELRDGTTRLLYWDTPSQTYWSGVVQAIVSSSASSKTYDARLHQGATQTLTVAESFTLIATDMGPA